MIDFYHSDHLGSSSLITNFDGEVTQHVEYIPYGEVFLEERNNTWNTPYLFNAKELDEETGLYYYGARYLNPMDGMWLSVDPMFDEYEGFSPYSLCANNPIVIKDEKGEWLNFVVGAFMGAATDYAFQVATNIIKNGEISTDAFTDVDMGSIGTSAITGAAGVGLISGISKLSKIARTAKTIDKATDGGKIVQKTEQTTKKVTDTAKNLKSERQKAVRQASKEEKNMVEKENKGTRRWTDAQKKELIENGKVKKFEGHHIKNVKDHPDYAGDPNNMEFVTKPEHLRKHGGNFRNSTDGNLLNRSVGE